MQLILVIKWEYIACRAADIYLHYLWLFFSSIVSFVVETGDGQWSRATPEIIRLSLFDIRPLVQFAAFGLMAYQN